ncbi:hypothetical protein KAFR_0H01320 [Kazachstania africana CBS 2517]|uniref:UDP-N-acetylglucosamine transferase subunit ALG14 n=1 Tax=Kazachstania africana (strain ATCC 22294 / BCRC 22015 / CBS 2517 / CECT 1963 / NBRC 1671 / NRRL Y-8276) TaxID=1071382 RepID=H2AYY6_KAZAF|nr:hypothetical protein KAFR_0H01320 [Kazachstania africana CBS 2517]CCF59542.1 hypothetical protein KAFR_0H01320 [Kazachstania africana CBS 2517]
MDSAYLYSVIAVVLTVCNVRLISILPFTRTNNDYRSNKRSTQLTSHEPKPLHLLVFLGSGGHTGEMLRLLQNYEALLLNKDNHLYVGYSDNESLDKLKKLMRQFPTFSIKCYHFKKAREVNSNVLQSIVSILQTLITSFRYILEIKLSMLGKPHLVLLNGPGTCCIIAVWVKLIDFFWLFTSSNIVYVESLARINTLSLTGKILNWLADEFIIQWEQLHEVVPRAKYFGILV